ncbi:MAG: hypothetical protein V1738_01665 [Patescibacteria group bacterium]
MNNPRHEAKSNERGFMIIMAIMFFSIVLIASLSLLNYVTSNHRIAKTFESTSAILQTAEAGIQKALFCLNSTTGSGCDGQFGDTYAGEDGIVFDGKTIDIVVFDADGSREVAATATDSTGESATVIVRVERAAETYTETAFGYALMAGTDLTLKSNAKVQNAPLYMNDDLTCDGGSRIETDVYISKPDGWINNCLILGDAHADRIGQSDISGDCYYNDIFTNSTCGGTEYSAQPTPPEQDFPTVDLTFWRQQASLGGYIEGNYSPADNTTLGPVVITGDLTLGNNIDVIMTGPIWVMGDLKMRTRSSLTLDSTFGELGSLVLVDNPNGGSGTIDLSTNTNISGSGEPGSYVVFVSTSTANPAIDIGNHAGGGLYYAPNGGIKLANNTNAIAVAGLYIEINNNSTVTYDTVGDPSALELKIATQQLPRWEIEPGTWREL